MKNNNRAYSIMLTVSVLISFLLFQHLIFVEKHLLIFFICNISINSITALFAYRNDKLSKEFFVPILSIFVLASAIALVLFGIYTMAIPQTQSYSFNGLLQFISLIMQSGLLVLSIQHVLPQKSRNTQAQINETQEF
jgi:hypothetical protein